VSARQAFDTNYILAIIDPRPEERNKARVALDPMLEAVVPCVAYGEAWEGLARGRPEKTAKKRKNFENAIIPLRMLWLDKETVHRFQNLFWTLSRQGTPIPSNDVWIAALCLQHDAVLITQDSDFKNVPGLTIRVW
jgi:predicted nucleic acid-binding protein